ncbi:MAG: biopolymer transporter ExbD [Terracidiphilus sp.]
MTMDNGNTGAVTSAINVTPMIDVLLVLLIIFMVIVPMTPRGESALVPKPATANGPQGKSSDVVLEVLKGEGSDIIFRINNQGVSRQELPARLAAIYANRAARVLFVKGDDKVSFAQIAQAIDISHAAGVDRIGLLTPGMQSGGVQSGR